MTLALLAPGPVPEGGLAVLKAGTVEKPVEVEGVVRIDSMRTTAADAVVFLEPVEAEPTPASGGTFQIDQRGLRFHPHVLVVRVGSTVEFSNSDDVLHNIFSPGLQGEPFDLGTWPRGESRTHRFDKTGVWVLLCNVHPDMEAYVVVVPTDLYARTDASGVFVLENVPPGDYLLRAWHESCEPYERRIEVAEGGPLALEIELEPLRVR